MFTIPAEEEEEGPYSLTDALLAPNDGKELRVTASICALMM